MAGGSKDSNKPLDSTLVELRSSVHNGRVSVPSNNVDSAINGHDSTNMIHNVLEGERIAATNSDAFTNDLFEHQQHQFSEGMPGLSRQNAIHSQASNMVDRRQSTVENMSSNSTEYSSNCLNKQSGMVDRSKATVEDTIDVTSHSVTQQCPSIQSKNAATNLVDRQETTVEDGPPKVEDTSKMASTQFGVQSDHHVSGSAKPLIASSMVDRQKKTVEDDTSPTEVTGMHSHDASVTTQIESPQPNHLVGSTGNMVDRQKRTVEDDIPSAQATSVNSGVENAPQRTGEQPNPHVGHNWQPLIARNIVDRHKGTIDDETPSAHYKSLNNRGVADATQIAGIPPNHHSSVNRQLPIAGNMVDRQKRTVEDGTTSPQATGVPSSGQENTTQITGAQPHNYFSGNTQSANAGNMVDRQKRTVEDDTPSAGVNNPGVSDGTMGRQPNYPVNGVELDQQFERSCAIADTRPRTSSSSAERWKIQLQVNVACSKDIIDHLPTSKCFEWNKSVVFGRGDNVDVFINDEHASRDHVKLMGQILPNGQVLFMILNCSRKGYNLNGQNITDSNRWNLLNKRDQIKIAGLIFVVDIIPGKGVMEQFVIEFILPQLPHSPVMPMPGVVYPPPFSPIGQPGFFNHPVQPCGNPGSFVAPNLYSAYIHPAYLPPNNGMPVHSNWQHSGMQVQPGLQMPAHLTSDMVQQVLQSYQDRAVKLAALRYLAHEVVGEWEELGRALGLQDWQLTISDRDYPGVAGKSYHMLKTWVWQNPEQATLVNLKRALEDVTVGRGDLAERYCTKENGDANLQNNGAEHSNVPESTNSGDSN